MFNFIILQIKIKKTYGKFSGYNNVAKQKGMKNLKTLNTNVVLPFEILNVMKYKKNFKFFIKFSSNVIRSL